MQRYDSSGRIEAWRAATAAESSIHSANPQTLGARARLWIYRYNLYTALYMLEPWERALWNIVVLTILALAGYAIYNGAVYRLFERQASSPM